MVPTDGVAPYSTDWGDATAPDALLTHTYAASGSFTVTSTDNTGAVASTVAAAVFSGAVGGDDDPWGPAFAFGLPYWIKNSGGVCYVGFDVRDGDPDPDVWKTWAQVLAMPISEEQKASISVQLVAVGCGP